MPASRMPLAGSTATTSKPKARGGLRVREPGIFSWKVLRAVQGVNYLPQEDDRNRLIFSRRPDGLSSAFGHGSRVCSWRDRADQRGTDDASSPPRCGRSSCPLRWHSFGKMPTSQARSCDASRLSFRTARQRRSTVLQALCSHFPTGTVHEAFPAVGRNTSSHLG